MKIKLIGEKWGHLGDHKIGDVVEAHVTRMILDPHGEGRRECELDLSSPGWEFVIVEAAFTTKSDELGVIRIPKNISTLRLDMEMK